MKTVPYYPLLFVMALTACSAAAVEAQKCSYDTNGLRYTASGNSEVKIRGGIVRTLKGTVTAPDGAPIANAELILFKITPGSGEYGETFIGSTESDENGKYCFGTLPRGRYALHARGPGFQRTEIDFKMVPSTNSNGRNKIDIQLMLGI